MTTNGEKYQGHHSGNHVSVGSLEDPKSGKHGYMRASAEIGVPPKGELWIINSPLIKKACIFSIDHKDLLGYSTLNICRVKEEFRHLIPYGFEPTAYLWMLDIGTSESGLGRFLWQITDKLLACSGGGRVFVADGSKDKWTSHQVEINQHMGLVRPSWSDGSGGYVYIVDRRSSVAECNAFMLQCSNDFDRPEA